VRVLRRRAIADAGELAGVLAGAAGQVEAGLTPLQRPVAAGEVTIDLACADASGRLVLVACDVVAGAETVLRAIEGAAWWAEHVALRPRVFADAPLGREAPPRALVAASRFSDRALRLLRALGPAAPEAFECGLFEDADGPVIGLERLDAASGRAQASPSAEAPPSEGGRAAALIERLERLRFSEGFR